MSYIDIRDLTVTYGDTPALDGFCLCAQRDDRVVILGPSGSGKTTLLLALCGLVPLVRGAIGLGGRRIEKLPPGKRRISMVFQDGALFPHLTGRQNIELPLKAARLSRDDRDRRVQRIAELMGIEQIVARRPAAMSGGERQRVAIARALVREPDLYVLDEPFASLDPALRHRMGQEVLDIHERVGAPFIHVTHDQSEALTMGTKVVVVCDGRIRQVGTPGEIYDEPADLFVAGFVGFPPMNLIRREDMPKDLGIVLPDLESFGAGPVVIGFRPEDVHVEPGGPAHLVSRQIQGHEQVLMFQTSTVRLTARLKRGKPLEGEGYRLSLPHGRLHVFDQVSGRRLA
ncbi:ABC transporter ATP-binding protein [Candidatus Fermentibacteria bacterium]|nr:ABC transporter ATP-binding protein [Candidatus Fermentibacteria bacterium]